MLIGGEGGGKIPLDVVAGQAKVFVHNKPGDAAQKLVGQAIQIGADGSLTAFLSCPFCPPNPSHVTLIPLSLSGNIGTSRPIYPWIHWDDGSAFINGNPYAIDWDVADSDVATVSEAWYNFRVQFEGVGTTMIGATMNECRYDPPFYPFAGYGFYDDCTCRYGAPVYALQRATATTTCPAPTGETTTATGRANENATPAAHKFVQTLKPTGTSFAGRTITESNTQAATDTCWFDDSDFRKVTGVTGGSWTVGSNNRWGPDHVGYTNLGVIQYYRDEGEAPCGFTMYQTLTISGCGGGSSSSVYRTNVRLKSTFTDTHVTVSRSGVSRTRMLTIE